MDKKTIFLGMINSLEEYLEINGDILKEVFEVDEDIEPFKSKPIIITEEEIKKYFGNYKDIKELRQKAIKYFADNIQGKTFDIGNYKNIRISRKSRDKYESYSADEKKLLIVFRLLEILKTSIYKKSENSYKQRKDEIIKFHYFINKVVIKEEKYEVYISIGEDQKGNLFYDLDKNKKP